MNSKLVEEVANAVLYEGYLLYPYRASAVKNRQRWNFGVVYPRAYAESQQGADSWRMQAECLGHGDSLQVRVRFLQLIVRETRNESGAVVETWQEAVEREVPLVAPSFDSLLAAPRSRPFTFPAEIEEESPQVIRRRQALQGTVQIRAEKAADGWFRLRLSIENAAPFDSADRERALLRSFVSTHAILGVGAGEFASLLDPPEALKQAAGDCRNVGVYPVLAGEPGSHDAMLCSPVILYDHPQIAPESAGALFDGTEIDEILSLRILTMTSEEKEEMRAVDGFARRILERTEALTPDQFMKMHGTLRSVDPAGENS